MSNSRRASRPTTKKNRVISPLFTHSRSPRETPPDPMRTDSSVCQKDAYEPGPRLAQARARSAAVSSTAALPVSVRRKSRSGPWALVPHSVCPDRRGLSGGSGGSSGTVTP